MYLNQMAQLKIKLLLIGEAPGYNGCRLTGIPFTSESTMLKGIDKHNLMGTSRGYQKTNESPKIHKEHTSTMVWDSIAKSKYLPLLWNAFPLHPFNEGNEQSNRQPNSEELNLGETFIIELIKIFNIEKVVAIGNKAGLTLNNLGIPFLKVRHPSRGGKKEFYEDIRKVTRLIEGISLKGKIR